MNRGKLSLTRLVVLILLSLLGLSLLIYKEQAENIVRVLLESGWPSALIWVFATASAIIGIFFDNPVGNNNGFIYQSFGKYADAIFTIATFGLAGGTSLALLKGLYLQIFFEGMFFSGFGDFDLGSICIISSFLLFYSITGITTQVRNIIFQVDAQDVTPA